MHKYIKSSNLPQGQVSLVVMSGEYKELCSRVEAMGIKTIQTGKAANLPKAEAYHGDMQLLHIQSDNILVAKDAAKLKDNLSRQNIKFIETDYCLGNKYPKNVILNVCLMEKFAIMNESYVDKKIPLLCEKINKIRVKQGYTKCSIAIVAENAIITSDNGIYKAISKATKEIDILKISPGNINLPGHDYGFIGGCCGKISKTDLLFTGNIKLHPDYHKIKFFCKNYGINLHSLTNLQLLDIGGILPIQEF